MIDLNANDTSDLEAKIKAKEQAAEEPVEAPQEELPEDDSAMAMLEKAGLPREHVAKAQEKYGTVLAFPWDSQWTFLLRSLNYREFSMLRKAAETEEEMNNMILKRSVLFPTFETEDELDQLPAGIPSTLVNMVLRISGFIAIEEAFASAKILG